MPAVKADAEPRRVKIVDPPAKAKTDTSKPETTDATKKKKKKKDSALGWLLCRCAMLVNALCIVVTHQAQAHALLLPGCVCFTSVILLAMLELKST